MASLTAEQITDLLSSARSRGEYDQYLKEFLASGDAGRLVERDGGILAGKSADQVTVGLNNAKKRTNDNGQLIHTGANMVKVIKRKDDDIPENASDEEADAKTHVFVINTALVEGSEGEAATDAEEETANVA